jgi:hypothetical protein
VEVPEHPNEHFLDEIFRTLAITDRAIDEIEEARLIAVDQGAEGLRVTAEVAKDELTIGQLVERLAL